MQMSAKKTKLMIDNTDIRVDDKKLETVHQRAIVNGGGSKPEILSMIAQVKTSAHKPEVHLERPKHCPQLKYQSDAYPGDINIY